MGYIPPARSVIAVECWIWYGVCLMVVIARYVSQRIIYGSQFMRNRLIDDYIMLLAVCTYTIGITGIYAFDGIFSAIDHDTLTPEGAAKVGRQLGIVNILTETAIQTTLWSIKASLLVVYYRLTFNLKYNSAVVAVCVFAALGYVTVIVALYYGWCRPFSQYLVLVPEVRECLTWKHYNIVQMTINILSDLMILIIPIATVFETRYTLERKIVLGGIFGLGIFTIIAAILQKVSVFQNPAQPAWILWSIREISTAIIVGNLVLCRPVLRKIVSYFGSFHVLPSLASRKTSRNTSTAETGYDADGSGMTFITVPPIMIDEEKNSTV